MAKILPMKRKEARSPLKDKPLRNPGQSVDDEVQRLLGEKLFSYFFLAGGFCVITIMEWYAHLMHVPRMPWLYTMCTVVLVAVAAFQVSRLFPRIRALKQGRDGEQIVAEQLDVLKRDGAHILHDVPGNDFNLDHVVISSKGIFAVETKTLSKPHGKAKIVFDGSKVLAAGRELDRNPVDQVSAQVTWLRRILKESTGKDFLVRGALVFPGWWTESTAEAKNSQLWVLEPKALPKWIKKEPQRLAEEEVRMASFHLQQYVRSKA